MFIAAAASAQPLVLPGAQAPSPAGTPQKAAPSARTSSAPRPAGTVPFIRAAGEDAVVERALKRNGKGGELVMQRRPDGFALRLTAEGYQTANLIEPCNVAFGGEALRLASAGKPAGSHRFRLEAPVCPMVFDVLNGAVFATEPAQPCVIEAAGCRIDLRGMWGPEGGSLVAQAREIDRARGEAEKAVRESYRMLLARADRTNQRLIAREQAAFSSEREVACRDYLREPAHGFCHARYTEARAVDLRLRLGLKDEPPKPKKPKPKPADAPAALAPPPQ